MVHASSLSPEKIVSSKFVTSCRGHGSVRSQAEACGKQAEAAVMRMTALMAWLMTVAVAVDDAAGCLAATR
jgi:hypothetical protein